MQTSNEIVFNKNSVIMTTTKRTDYMVLAKSVLASWSATLGGLSTMLRLRAHALFKLMYKDYYMCTFHNIAVCVPGTNRFNHM